MRLTGHKTEAVYRRYAITDAAMLQEAAAKLDAFLASEVIALNSMTRTKTAAAPPPFGRSPGSIGAMMNGPVFKKARIYGSFSLGARSSTGQSIGLRIRGLGVQIPPGAPKYP